MYDEDAFDRRPDYLAEAPEDRQIRASVSQASLAQLVEQCFRKAEVPGSTPGAGSIKKDPLMGLFCILPHSTSSNPKNVDMFSRPASRGVLEDIFLTPQIQDMARLRSPATTP